MHPYCSDLTGCNHSVVHPAGRTEAAHMSRFLGEGRQQVGLAEVAAHRCSAAVHNQAAEPGTHSGTESILQAESMNPGYRKAGCLHYNCKDKEKQRHLRSRVCM